MMKIVEILEPTEKLHASEKSMILATPCQNLLAGSIGGGEDILEKVEEPPPGQEAPKGRFFAAESFAVGSTAKAASSLPLPIYVASVQAGFPSPAEDYLDKTLDLNELLIAHPAATFFVRVAGDSMRNAGIFSGDILVVDRSLEPGRQ